MKHRTDLKKLCLAIVCFVMICSLNNEIAHGIHYPDDENFVKETKLPLPNAKLYGLTGTNAAIFDASVAYWSCRVKAPDLIIPCIAIVDSYTINTTTYYICWLKECIYGNVRYGAKSDTMPEYDEFPESMQLLRFEVCQLNNGDIICVNVFPEIDSWQYFIEDICGPQKHLSMAYRSALSAGESAVYLEQITENAWITPESKEDLLAEYLNYYIYDIYDDKKVNESTLHRGEPSFSADVSKPFTFLYALGAGFGLEDWERTLYDAAVLSMGPYYGSNTLQLPTVAVLETIRGSDNVFYCIAWITNYGYKDLGLYICDEEISDVKYQCEKHRFLCNFELRKLKNGEWVCSKKSIMLGEYSKDDFRERLKSIGVTNSLVEEQILSNAVLDHSQYYITPQNPQTLLNEYLEYYIGTERNIKF